MTTRRFPTAFLAILALVLATVVIAVAAAGPARAHSELISSTPEDSADLTDPPDAVVLEFNENIQDIGNEIVVTAPDGTDVVDGDPQIDGAVVTQALAIPTTTTPYDAAGQYTVTWRVVSADGHPISGEFSFEVLVNTWDDVVTTDPTTDEPTTETTTEATSETSAAAPTSSAAEDDDTQSGLGDAAPIIIGVAVVLLVGAAILVVRRRRAR